MEVWAGGWTRKLLAGIGRACEISLFFNISSCLALFWAEFCVSRLIVVKSLREEVVWRCGVVGGADKKTNCVGENWDSM